MFRKSLASAGLAIALSLTGASALAQDAGAWQSVKKAGVLRCGAAVAPPYVMHDPKTGEYSGFFSELCRNFGEKVLKVKVEFVDTTWDNIVAGLQSNKWDLSMALNDTPEREKAIAFSAPATDYNVTLVYNKNNPKNLERRARHRGHRQAGRDRRGHVGRGAGQGHHGRAQTGSGDAPARQRRDTPRADVETRRPARGRQHHQHAVDRSTSRLGRGDPAEPAARTAGSRIRHPQGHARRRCRPAQHVSRRAGEVGERRQADQDIRSGDARIEQVTSVRLAPHVGEIHVFCSNHDCPA
ncbi:transporter substrate-binding domain-containing protein [Caballeronia sp. LZ035]|uniref:transporter substrate-binding domain-containing protein n=1 Tax=Caballeronia sp. LZ035 TaxID=3038568 RepID=UPI0038D359C4